MTAAPPPAVLVGPLVAAVGMAIRLGVLCASSSDTAASADQAPGQRRDSTRPPE